MRDIVIEEHPQTTIFTPNFKNAWLIFEHQGKNTLIVRILDCCRRSIENIKLPLGQICHCIGDKHYKYDACCSAFIPKFLPDFNVHAVYISLKSTEVKSILGRTVLYGNLVVGGTNVARLPFREFAPNHQYKTFDNFIKARMFNGDIGFWITPNLTVGKWMVLPCADVPPRPFNYNAVYANMKRFGAQVFSQFPDVPRIHYGFGLVVLPGKMVINGILLQCPSELQLASSYMCQYRVVTSTITRLTLLSSHHPFTPPSSYFQAVRCGGDVLVKTVIKDVTMNFAKRESSPTTKASTKVPNNIYNYSLHPLLGKIVFSSSMVFSESAKVIIGFDFCPQGKKVKSPGVWYRVISVHDGGTILRIPDVSDTMFQAKNAHIQMGFKSIGDVSGTPTPLRNAPPLRSSPWSCNIRVINLNYLVMEEHKADQPMPLKPKKNICGSVRCNREQQKTN